MSKKKTLTKTTISTKTVLLVMSATIALAALAYVGFKMNKKRQAVARCEDSCLEYKSSNPEYVGVCQKSCSTGEVVIYSETDSQGLETPEFITEETIDQGITVLPEENTTQQ